MAPVPGAARFRPGFPGFPGGGGRDGGGEAGGAEQQPSPTVDKRRRSMSNLLVQSKIGRILEVETAGEAQQGGANGFGLSQLLPQPCDTSYDCERPLVCCFRSFENNRYIDSTRKGAIFEIEDRHAMWRLGYKITNVIEDRWLGYLQTQTVTYTLQEVK